MELKGKNVRHKIFGEGTVNCFDGVHVEVEFAVGVKKFSYPDAFNRFLTLEDEEAASEISGILKEKEQEKEDRLQKLTESLEPKKEAVKKPAEKKVSFHKTIRKELPDIILKCNYCDGGASEACIGYCGICSDDVIDYNITTAQKITCSAENSPCRLYNAGEITREELDNFWEDNAVICPECRLLKDWIVDTGMMISEAGSDRSARIADAEPGSLCILTAKDPDEAESGRYIFAAFLTDDVEDDENSAGTRLYSASGYRIVLTDEEAHKMPLWKYNNSDNGSTGVTLWNAGLYRYTSDKTAMTILKDICELKKGTSGETDADRLLDAFIKLTK